MDRQGCLSYAARVGTEVTGDGGGRPEVYLEQSREEGMPMEMWQRFTSRARRAVILAHNQAQLRGLPLISTEHLLAGLVHLSEGGALEVLKGLGVDVARLRSDLETHLDSLSPGEEPAQQVAFTPEAQRVLSVAYAEAKRLRHSHVGTEHLLLGLLHETRGAASRLLRKHGLTLPKLRKAIRERDAQRAQKPQQPPLTEAVQPRDLLQEFSDRVRSRELVREVYDFHTHTFLSDGVLSPIELIRRATVKGYGAIGLADHVGAATMERVIREAASDCELAARHWNFRAFPGVELTHVPAASIAELAARAKLLGATHVVVHGESPVEPVEPGTNRAAVECKDVDILAHPGLLTLDEALLAARNGVFVEITAKEGHSLGNGRVYSLARQAGALCVLSSDTHLPDHILTPDFARTVALAAGALEKDLNAILAANPAKLVARIMERLK
jgi:putative hydrolase